MMEIWAWTHQMGRVASGMVGPKMAYYWWHSALVQKPCLSVDPLFWWVKSACFLNPIPSSVSKSWRFSQFFLMFLFKSPPETLISLISNYSFLPCGTQPLNRKRSRLLRIGVATDMAEFGTLGLLLLVSLGVQDGFQVLVKKLELKPW